jgi:hypothetical protein
MLHDVRCDRARHAAHVIERKIVGDQSSPTVSAKFYICHEMKKM